MISVFHYSIEITGGRTSTTRVLNEKRNDLAELKKRPSQVRFHQPKRVHANSLQFCYGKYFSSLAKLPSIEVQKGRS